MRAQPEAIAISFLFSFANTANETRVAAALADSGKPLSVSHQILPEFREYERTSTVVVNAYLQPLMQRYMEKLAERVEQIGTTARAKSRIFVMQSNGGIAALESAAREPVRTVLSGPAGGLVGAAAAASRSGFAKILSFDMGGTSTDVAAVQGEISAGNQSEVAGLPVGVPMLEIHTVGAGGGSLARFDAGGLLRVGPESAGADPGPICYGRGTQPTVTDANLILGRLRPDRFLGGEFTLDMERTRRIAQGWLDKECLDKQQPNKDGPKKQHMTLEHFARGVLRVVNANMERALRVVSIERGYDPRDFALVAFGGAGGLHACELAEALSIPTVIIPARPGALSAFGILVSDVVKDFSRTLLWRLDGSPASRTSKRVSQAGSGGAEVIRRRAMQSHRAVHYERTLDLRYRGQGYELNVPAGGDAVARFHEEHQRRYGYHHPDREIELVTVRLRAKLRTPSLCGTDTGVPGTPRFGVMGWPAPVRAASVVRGSAAGVKPVERARVIFEKPETTPVYERSEVPTAHILRGPAIITEYSATTVIPPGKQFHLDRAGNLVIDIRRKT